MAHYSDFTLDDARSVLDFTASHCSDFDVWYRVGAALQLEFGEAAYDMWESWSSGYAKFSSADCRRRWKKFKGSSSQGSVTIGYLIKLGLDAGWKFERPELTAEQKKAFAVELESKRKVLDAQRKKEEEYIALWHEVVAEACARIWPLLHPTGNSPYLGKKKVEGYGVGFARTGLIIHTIEAANVIRLVEGKKDIEAFFAAKNNLTQFFYVKPGDVLIPLRNAAGRLMNLQIISMTGKKLFMRNGRKMGLYHFIGPAPEVGGPIAIAEGYATAASAHKARGWPVAVAIDAGNLPIVAASLFKLFPHSLFLILADDDRETEKANLRRLGRDENERDFDLNPGLKKAQEAALICGGAVVVPCFNESPRVIANV